MGRVIPSGFWFRLLSAIWWVSSLPDKLLAVLTVGSYPPTDTAQRNGNLFVFHNDHALQLSLVAPLGLTGGLAAPLVAAGAATIIGSAGAAALGSTAGIAVMTSLFGAAGAGLTGERTDFDSKPASHRIMYAKSGANGLALECEVWKGHCGLNSQSLPQQNSAAGSPATPDFHSHALTRSLRLSEMWCSTLTMMQQFSLG